MAAPDAGVSPKRKGGDEAVCFTAGPQGAAFGAGVIHAWLASDRPAPAVVAGISTGALTAAAMQRAFRGLAATPLTETTEKTEQARWTWFRKYLQAVTVEPLDFVWRSIPDPVDFFAEKPPVRDLAAAQLPADMRREIDVKDKNDITEPAARRHYYLLTKLGIWLASLPLEVRTIARIAVHYVRFKEATSRVAAFGQWLLLVRHCATAGMVVLWHVATSPTFLSEYTCLKRAKSRIFFRPLFSWTVWFSSVLFLLGLVAATVAIAAAVLAEWQNPGSVQWHPWLFLTGVSLLGVYLFAGPFTPLLSLSQSLDLSEGLLYPFELKRRLADLFGEALVGRENEGEPEALLVCAALEHTKQVWPDEKQRVIDALTAALAIPGVFPPVKFARTRLKSHPSLQSTPDWDLNSEASLIDGVAVRSNPVPALFTWCQERWRPNSKGPIAPNPLDPAVPDARRRLHVVYSVPIDDETRTAAEQIDIVESARTALQLAQRRDTRQEVRQTNFLSHLEGLRRLATGQRKRFRILADEIAPSSTIEYANEWEPTREESLRVAAQGCRQTLQVICRNEIGKLAGRTTEVQCADLLRVIAPARNASCGLPEICCHCTKTLVHRAEPDPEHPPHGILRTWGAPTLPADYWKHSEFPHDRFEHLVRQNRGEQPRVAFLGSGGVFRGAFHIGVIGALHSSRAYPDLVIGASVGALMGGALANISVSTDEDAAKVIARLTELFLCVDRRVALTHTLKSAMKHLGTSASNIRLSPADVREMVLKGSREDSGYAATGAPPALIDAINSLLLIPHRETADIASDFVSGNFTRATKRFLAAIREHTLENLRIRSAFMGTSLLRHEAGELLGAPEDLRSTQPYHQPKDPKKQPVSFFCTTSYLNRRTSLLLGRDFLTATDSWDFVEAALSSAAFPAVFSPRAEAQVCPGRGRTDRLFADGGMFDNLPIVPAIEILAASQTSANPGPLADVLKRLDQRVKHPDLLLTAGLEAVPADSDGPWDSCVKIHKRAGTLAVKSKVDSFLGVSTQTQKMLKDICDNPAVFMSALTTDEERRSAAAFLDSAVSSRIVNVVPTDAAHINGTFAFCRAAGMDKKTVQTSVADGCFRTLAEFLGNTGFPTRTTTPVKVEHLAPGEGRTTAVTHKQCPWFQCEGKPLDCPFAAAEGHDKAQVRAIRHVCAKDAEHARQFTQITASQQSATSPQPAPPPSTRSAAAPK